jgi:hypothetical protein
MASRGTGTDDALVDHYISIRVPCQSNIPGAQKKRKKHGLHCRYVGS